MDLWGLQAVNYNAMLAISDPEGFSQMIDQRNEIARSIDVKLSVTAGPQAGGTYNDAGLYINLANVELFSIGSEKGGQNIDIGYVGKNNKAKVSNTFSFMIASVEHSFDAYRSKSENSEVSASLNFLGVSQEVYNSNENIANQKNTTEVKKEKIIDIDISFLIGVHLDISINTNDDKK